MKAVLHTMMALLLSSCTLGPDYLEASPATLLPGPYANAPRPVLPTVPVSPEWWRELRDPTLDALVGDALAHNLDLAAASARLRQSRARRSIAAADGLPTLDVSGMAQRQRTSGNVGMGAMAGGGADGMGGGAPGGQEGGSGTPGAGGTGGATPEGPSGGGGGGGGGMPTPTGATLNLFQASFDAAWEVDLFGATRARVRAADARLEAAALTVEDVRTSIAAEVARDYLVVREVQARLAVARETLALARRTREVAREQERAGLVTEADTARSDAEALAIETALPQLELIEIQAAQRLAVMAAREPSALRATLAPSRPIPAARPVKVGLPAELLLRRPDVRVAERNLAAATNSEAAAVRDLYPKLSLNASAGTQADRLKDLFDWESRFYRLAANLTAPILDGGRRRAEVELARGQVDEAIASYRSTILTAFREVEDGLAALEGNRRRLALAERTAERRRKARAVLAEQYGAGLIGILDLLAAERDLADARNTVANARAQVTVNWIGLQKALGGGWQVRIPAPAKAGNS